MQAMEMLRRKSCGVTSVDEYSSRWIQLGQQELLGSGTITAASDTTSVNPFWYSKCNQLSQALPFRPGRPGLKTSKTPLASFSALLSLFYCFILYQVLDVC